MIKTKKELWKKVKQDIIKEIGAKYAIEVKDLDRDSKYFHPIIILEDCKIQAQCDVDNEFYYAPKLLFKGIIIDYKSRDTLKETIKSIKRGNLIEKLTEIHTEVTAIQTTIDYLDELIKIKKTYAINKYGFTVSSYL